MRAFLGDKLTEDLRAAALATTGTFSDLQSMQSWHAILNARGWAAPSWPAEYGGQAWSDLPAIYLPIRMRGGQDA